MSPAEVVREGRPAEQALRALREQHEPLVTLPGDEYVLIDRLPASPGEREIFLESRGYYLEWMRPQWIEEENPALAARMVMDPARSLRQLAPRYKAVEPEMERVVWSSRYARR